jgi:hypothetical protein
MALTRLLYEALFPAAVWLGRPLPAIVLAAVLAAAITVLGRALWRRPLGALAVAPLLLNLFYLPTPAVDLVRGWLLFFGSLWLCAVLLSWVIRHRNGWRPLGMLFLIAALLPIYLLTMSHAVGAADTFEFQVIAPRLGIAHPTGYPLYLLLGKLATLLPVGTVAWRLNMASAVYALGATIVVYFIGCELTRRPLLALLGALWLGLAPVFWSQAIVAEVYALHALLVALALWLMVRLVEADDGRRPADREKTAVALAFVLGMSLANHLTTLFLLPPAAVALVVWYRRGANRRLRSVVWLLVAFTLPLLLYAYLPLRWAAVNGEPMGAARFVEWVAGGRFQGALQWMAWLRDPARWSIVARLLLDAWGWFGLGLAGLGLVYLVRRQRLPALLLALAAVGFAFYALNYYVPDLSVFLIPAHVVIGVLVACGAALLVEGSGALETRLLGRNRVSTERFRVVLVFLLCASLVLLRVAGAWPALDQSLDDGGEPWGRGVLSLPLAEGAAVLADSEKIAPLYYLQQVEGVRPDLNIMVLPDEAAYRAELDRRVAAGQAVYLARFLPGLAGAYHLRSVGPLVEASGEPLQAVPDGVQPGGQTIGPLVLRGVTVEPRAAVDDGATALTLYWQRVAEASSPPPVVYLRWVTPAGAGPPVVATGRHPAGDAYPINAWREGEIVPDYHLLPHPVSPCQAGDSCLLGVQVAVAPRFTPAAELDWQTVAEVGVPVAAGPVGQPQRALYDGFALDGLDAPGRVRAGQPPSVGFSGSSDGNGLQWLLVPESGLDSLIIPAGRRPDGPWPGESRAYAAAAEGATAEGTMLLLALPPVTGDGTLSAVCGWLARPTTGCVAAEVEVSGAALPEGAVNFGDKLALLDVGLPSEGLTSGGQLPVTITWQGLAEMAEDYTVTVQVLDAADRIVGQVDSWPVQGTFPTSQWTPGETVSDPYIVQVSDDISPGDYRVIVGVYLLATLERLPVVDENGNPIDDKVEVQVIYD